MSYPKRSESVCLELFEAFQAFCKRNNFGNFHLHLRLSQEKVNTERWDGHWIKRQIQKLGGAKNIERVWVCGPPAMNETFDRAFSINDAEGRGVHADEALLGDSILAPDQYDIL